MMSSTTNNNNNSKEDYDDAFTKAASFAFAQVFPAILNAAVDMNLFDIISKAESSLGMSASEIASKIPKQHSEMGSRLERMLPSLVARSLLTCSIRTINEDGDTERVYAVSPVGQYYTSNHHDEQGGSCIALSTLFYRGYRHVWKDMKDAILDANNHNHFQRMYGKMAFEYMETDRELGNLFGEAMSQAGPLGVKSILDAYKGGFDGISTLVDVGGGYGQVLKQILFQYPSIQKAINFDLPHVVKNAPPHPDTKDAILDANNHNHFQRMYGKMAFEYMETDRELGNLFGEAMSQAGPLGVKSILDAYKGGFDGISTLVDVGGGYGQVLKQILFQYPSIQKAINFDLPHVVKNAPPHPGIEHMGGDMFKTVPKGDAILLKHVCHSWEDEECVKVLRNCYEALPPHGKVIVMDALLPEIPKSTSFKDTQAVDLDFLMFLVSGGKERAEKQFEKLCKTSGFSRFQVACNDSSNVFAVMEFYK